MMFAHSRARLVSLGLCSLSALVLAGAASAAPQTPDVTVYDIGYDGSDTNDIHYWGQNSGIAAYSFATQSCNSGTKTVEWITASGSTHHPVIAQNMFRLKDGRFEQLGQSWLKHGFCAVNETEAFCAPCQSTPCDSLGIGCADTYWATLNDGGGGQSKKNVNAADGTHVHGGSPSGNTTIRGRLQCAVSDMDPAQNTGAKWFIEGQYITGDDAQAGASSNNASWRRVNVNSVTNITGNGGTMRQEPAIYAWKFNEAGVEIQEVANVENAGAKTEFILGYKVTDLGHGQWSYEYALQNLNSDQSAGSLSLPAHPSSMVHDIGFHDVAYHSGDPFDGTNWPGTKDGGEIRWATTPFGTNVNANAIRWGTMYNFRFVSNSPPERGPATIGLFKPAVNTDVTVPNVWVPTGAPDQGPRASTHGAPGPIAGPIILPLTTATPRNGTRANAPVLIERAPAVLGGTWRAGVELEEQPESVLFLSFVGATSGTFNTYGEILVRAPFVALPGDSFEVPNDSRLAGLTFSAQAAFKTSAGWQLTNALDVTVGSTP
jgi:hypothetical protein